MKHLIRIFLIFIALVALLMGTAVLVFHIVFPPAKLQRMAVDGIRGFVDREARIERLSAGFSGLSVKKFALSEYPDFRAGTFLQGDELLLRWRLLPLLQHRLVVGEARLTAPSVEVYRTASGEYNYSGLSRQHAARTHQAMVFPALLISKLSVQGGTILFKDSGIALQNIDLSADDLSLLSPFDAKVAFTVKKGNLAAAVSGTVTVDIKTQTLVFKDAAVGAAGKPALRLSGKVSDLARPDALRFDVTVTGDRIALENLTALIPELAALQFFVTPTVSLTLSGTLENLQVSFNK